jgi:5-methylcytosine-specific restriction endonuclease McrA
MGSTSPRQIKSKSEKLFTRHTSNIYFAQAKRAKKAGKQLDYSLAEFRSLFAIALAEGKCWYCHRPITAKASTADHAQPVSREGCQSIKNLRITCLLCNLAKGSLTEEEFYDVLDMAAHWPNGVRRDFLSRLKAGARYITNR